MLDKLLNYIMEQKLFQPTDRLLLAVSGGVDSMVLASLFHQAEFHFSIAHCNFRLRGAESDKDEALVTNFAKNHGIPLFTRSFATNDYAGQKGISIQMAARELRRDWFAKLMEQEGFDFIATAHHLNDAVETTLFNLTKGTGIAGLRGIEPKSSDYVRPLLFATRDMISDYANAHSIEWREDKSNQSSKYARNLIRHDVVPELKKINPSLEETYAITQEKLAATERIYANAIDRYRLDILSEKNETIRIELQKLLKIPDHLMVLFELIKDFGFNFAQAKDIINAVDHQPGAQFHSPNFTAALDRNYLLLDRRQKINEVSVEIKDKTREVATELGSISLERISAKQIEFGPDQNLALVDADHLKYPLKLRNWRHGDRFQPLGMSHKKKLSDFMIDEKIPLNLKQRVLVLESGDDIIWVVGHRIDDRYKITPQTQNVLKIRNLAVHD